MLVRDLMSTEFACALLNEVDLKFSNKFMCLDIDVDEMSIENVMKHINFRSMFLKLEFSSGKSFVISNADVDTPFEELQKKYKDKTSYYFMANDDMACFKILDGGKITRKVASYGKIRNGGIISEEQTLGKPCDYETATGKVYKMKYDTRVIDLSKEDVFKIIDYYIGFENLDDDKIISKRLYYCVKPQNLPFAMQCFETPEFMQGLIHLGNDASVCEYTYPILISVKDNTLFYSVFKQRYHIFELNNAKKVLKINIFNAKKEKLICEDCRGFDLFSVGDFLCSLATCIAETRSPFADYQNDSTKIMNSFDKPKDYNPKKCCLIYFATEYVLGKFNLSVHCTFKNGKEEKSKFIARLEKFDKQTLLMFYNRVLDYVLDQNISSYID